MRKNPTAVLVAIAVLAVATGCDTTQDGGPRSEKPVQTNEVSVVDNAFEPEVVEVTAGETVTWTWEGSARHDVDGDGFQSEVQTSGTFEHTFDSPGEYSYICNIHPAMTGTVIVVEEQ